MMEHLVPARPGISAEEGRSPAHPRCARSLDLARGVIGRVLLASSAC